MKRIGLFFIFLFFLFFVFFIYKQIYLPKDSNNKEEVIFQIKKGEGVRNIAFNLEKEGLIRSRLIFQLYVGLQRKMSLQAGFYQLSPSLNIPQIVSKFSKGDVLKKRITILEGWTIKDIAKYLDKEGIVNANSFINYAQKHQLEGYLFPDTYEFNYGENVEKITKRMEDNFNKKLTDELRREIRSQGRTISEIVIMASLIEKEAQTLEDKKIVSGILWKRLEHNMPLQVDATINYIIGENKLKISAEETKIDSPYNTYKYKGLPPAPICNPGMESIEAAIKPKKTPYWYYLSDKNSLLHFSKTLQEHNIAKAKYLR